MTRVYRILRRPYCKSPLDGEGAFRYGGRWSSPGTRLVYTAEHLSLAMVEYFVHLDVSDLPRDLVVVTIEVPAGVSRQSAGLTRCRNAGDEFVDGGRAAVLTVPSLLAPEESNWLLNPAHQDFSRIRVAAVEPFRYDARFFE